MIEEFNNFKEGAFYTVKYEKEILEHWKQSLDPVDQALAYVVLSKIGGNKT